MTKQAKNGIKKIMKLLFESYLYDIKKTSNENLSPYF